MIMTGSNESKINFFVILIGWGKSHTDHKICIQSSLIRIDGKMRSHLLRDDSDSWRRLRAIMDDETWKMRERCLFRMQIRSIE